MSPAEAAAILKQLDGWPAQHHSTKKVQEEIDAAVEMIGRLEAAEKTRDFAKEEVERLLALAHDQNNELIRLREEGRTLRAKIAKMERQEPVAWTTKLALRHGANALGFDACAGNLWGEKGVPLYALPGAKGEDK